MDMQDGQDEERMIEKALLSVAGRSEAIYEPASESCLSCPSMFNPSVLVPA
jgi:hypothetical protein